MPIADSPHERRPIGWPGHGLRRHQQKIVAQRMGLDQLHLRQNASRCQPNRRTSRRGRALKVPTKIVLNTRPFHPPCSRDFTGKRSSTIRISRKPLQHGAEPGGAVLAEHRGVLVLERHLHQLRQGVQPGHPVVDLKDGFSARLQDTPALVDQRRGARRVLHHAVGEHEIECAVCIRQVLAVGFAQIGLEPLLGEFWRASAIADAERSTPLTMAPALGEAHQVGAGAAADVEHALAAVAVEAYQPQQVVELLEMILIEVARRSPASRARLRADLEIVDVMIPVVGGRRRGWDDPGRTRLPTIE